MQAPHKGIQRMALFNSYTQSTGNQNLLDAYISTYEYAICQNDNKEQVKQFVILMNEKGNMLYTLTRKRVQLKKFQDRVICFIIDKVF